MSRTGSSRVAQSVVVPGFRNSHEAADHVIFIGEVAALGLEDECTPLLFHSGEYRQVEK